MNGNNRGLLIGIGAGIGLILLLVIINWSLGNSVANAGNKKEAALEAVYPQAQNELSNCEVKSAQAVQVVNAQVRGIDKILTDAVKGRYDNGNSNAPQVDSGKFFSAIAEAYPNLNNVSQLFKNVLTVVNGCRDDYRDMQNKLLSNLSDFDKWRNGSWKVRHYGKGFPNDNLIARLGTQRVTGKPAEEQMWKIVLTSSVVKEYESGTLDPSTLNLFPATTTTG